MPPSSAATNPAPARDPHASWFSAEVQAHDASLRSYLRGAFPAVRDAEDLVQESYLRLWRASARERVRSTKAFLFTIARRLALDHLRRDRRSPLKDVGDSVALNVIQDGTDVVDDVGRRERLQLLAQAIAGLPPRCRDVFIIYKVQGLPRKEAAARLGLSEKTIESHTAHAMRHCEAFFRRRDLKGLFGDAKR